MRYVLTVAVLLINIQFSANSTIMLLAALHYASVCSYASTLLLCSKLCQHNLPGPMLDPLSLVPRLFLIEERAWQHWGVGAVYFRYVMVHVIYSDHTLFLKIIM